MSEMTRDNKPDLYKILHDAFGEYLTYANTNNLDPRQTIAELIEFCANECANGHAKISYKLKLDEAEIQNALRTFGNAFTNTFHARLLKIGNVLN